MRLAVYIVLLCVPVLASCVGCNTIFCHVANHEYGPGQTAYACR